MKVIELNGKFVTETQIIGTNHYVYTVYEPVEKGNWATHHTYMTVNDKHCGQLGTRRLPEELEKLKPGSQERIDKVKLFRLSQYVEAYKLIIKAFPDVVDSMERYEMGQIDTYRIPSV